MLLTLGGADAPSARALGRAVPMLLNIRRTGRRARRRARLCPTKTSLNLGKVSNIGRIACARLVARASACCRGLQPMVGQSKLKFAPAQRFRPQEMAALKRCAD
jgi:hypothetical protein